MMPNQTPQKKLHLPIQYQYGQQPTTTGMDISLRLQSIDFTPQTRGGRNMTFAINKFLFAPEDVYRKAAGLPKR